MADLLRQRRFADVPTWTVVASWDPPLPAFAATRKVVAAVGEVVRLSGDTVPLQDAADTFLDHHDLARSAPDSATGAG